jgi:hypothetical protein
MSLLLLLFSQSFARSSCSMLPFDLRAPLFISDGLAHHTRISRAAMQAFQPKYTIFTRPASCPWLLSANAAASPIAHRIERLNSQASSASRDTSWPLNTGDHIMAIARINRRERHGAATLWIIVGVAALIAGAIILIFSLGSPPKPVTGAAYSGSVSSPATFPTVVDSAITVTYYVKTRNETRPSGAGAGFPPTTASPWVNADSVDVTFILADDDATFDDGTIRKTVETDSAGNATVTIKPNRDGDDTLSFQISISGQTQNDSTTFDFEVTVP